MVEPPELNDILLVTAGDSDVSLGSHDDPDADPILTEVIRHGLNAAAEHMAVSLKRAAFSPVIYEVNDFACALFDDRRRLLAQAQIFPLFLGTLHFCVEAALKAVGGAESLQEGDVIFTNYAYDVGSHQQDAVVVVPAFLDGAVVGYAAVKAHHIDIGAKEPYCTDTVDVFQEGTIFPGIRIFKAGKLDDDLYRTLLANSRIPSALEGDLFAQISAAEIGNAGLVRLIERYSRDVFDSAVDQMFRHGERLVRDFLSKIPDGRYTGRSLMDSNGRSAEPVPLEISLEVTGSEVVADFTSCAPQQEGPVNCPLASTVSAARMAIMALAGGTDTVTEGHFRPISVRVRKGSMYHPSPPAPVYLYYWAALQAVDVIHQGVALELPELVGAGSGGDICCLIWWGYDADGVWWCDGNNHFTGQGADHLTDAAAPLIHIGAAGMRNHSAEVWEARRPVLIERMELVPDTAGAGNQRGGLAVAQHYRALLDCYVTFTVERTATAPWGAAGGLPGRPNHAGIRRPDGTYVTCAKATGVFVEAGSTIEVFIGSGGGYGPPEGRSPAKIDADVREGYYTLAGAQEVYPHWRPESAGLSRLSEN